MNPAEPDLAPLWLSLRSAALAVACVAPLGVLAALQVNRWRGSRRTVADLLLLTPLVLPPTVVGFILLQVLGRYGPIGEGLNRFGLQLVFSWPAVVLSAAVVSFPLMYRTALAALDQTDPSLTAVALSLGAGPLRVIREITLPLAWPGLLAGISLSYARALGEFGTTLMLAGNIPGRTQTLPLAIYAAVEAGDLRLAWFWTILVLLLNGLCLALVQGFQSGGKRRRIAGSAQLPPAELPPQQPVATPAMATQGPPDDRPFALLVDLVRRHGSFQLHLQFETACPRVAILGASGAGKSLLLRCLAGLERPDRGRICLNGQVLFDSERGIDRPLQRRRIAMVFQHHALFPHLTVAQNVSFGLAHRDRARRRQQVWAQLEALNLLPFADRFPDQLSGGQQQRVALARALVTRPQLLLLDEPFSSQDTHRRRQLQHQTLEHLARSGVPSLLVSHDMDEAYRLSEELLVIGGGQLLTHAPKRRVFDQPRSREVARLTGCKNITRVEWRAPHQLWAPAWGIALNRDHPWPADTAFIGIRANHLKLRPFVASDLESPANRWPCRVVDVSEGALTVSVYVVPQGATAAQALEPIHVEVSQRSWRELAFQQGRLTLLACQDQLMALLR